MTITVNGQQRQIESELTLAEYLNRLGLDLNSLAIEHNREIVGRDALEARVIRDNDQIEIIQFVGGG